MRTTCSTSLLLGLFLLSGPLTGQTPKNPKASLPFPPTLPEGKTVVTDKSDDFLKAIATIGKDVAIAKTPPTVDFLYYPGQDYEGKPWSNWGDSLAVGGKYYASVGDHLALGKGDRTGTAHVFEYDPATKSFRQLVDVAKLLDLPKDHYVPGKIHSRIDLGSDGWLYYSTHRGSTTVTADKNHYEGDWILRSDPRSGKSEVVARGPVPKHCIPTSVIDPNRLIFYGGTAPGTDAKEQGVQFFAYDIKKKKLLYSGPDGPARAMIFAPSTGCVYYVPGNETGTLMRYDPASGGAPVKTSATLGLRAATQVTPQGIVYTVSNRGKGSDTAVYAFNTKNETVESLGTAAVGVNDYITSIDADATGRYLYYVPGAHGGSEKDGSAVVQFDTKTKTKKVIAFLHPFYKDKYGVTLAGTFSTAIDPKGDKLYVTWNANRGGKVWDCCALTVIHIPESERPQ
ncbi:hypothetical protein BH11PLA2_BH11PLA2_17860 [soil metagenome]